MGKLKVVTVVGTRPEIIRLAECIKLCDQVFDHVLVHTGQNYDYTLNEIFFEDLELRKPDYFLEVVGTNLGETMGNVVAKSFSVLSEVKPDALLVLGDTNSVLCTIAAKRLKIPIFHMEAGNRCFDQNVPEEINRRIADHISDINLPYTEHSRRYLLSEGFRKDHIFVTGSPLYEVLNKYKDKIDRSDVLRKLEITSKNYILLSLHREENIDLKDHFPQLIQALNSVAEEYNLPIVFSTHPRTQKKLESSDVKLHPLIRSSVPFSFSDYVHLQKNAFCVLSDSGSVSEEAAMLGFPAVSIRTSTERPEAIDAGTIVLGGISSNEILNSIRCCLISAENANFTIPSEYKIADVSVRVVRLIQSYTGIVNRETWRK